MNINYTNENTFIFCFARMNPPTPGHLDLIKQMIYKAADLKVNQVYVILSSSLDGLNPLPCNAQTIPSKQSIYFERFNPVFKLSILNEMIDNYKQMLINQEPILELKHLISQVRVNIFCSYGNPFAFINNNIIKPLFIDNGIDDINIFFVVGRDRADFFDKIIDMFQGNASVQSIDGMVLERTGMSEALTSNKSSSISTSAMSASYVRKKVNNNLREEFNEIYKDYLPKETIDHLYDGISHGLTIPFKAKHSSSVNPRSKYYDYYDPNNSNKKILPIVPSVLENVQPLSKKRRQSDGGSRKRLCKKKTRVKRKYHKRQKSRRRQRSVNQK